MRTKVMLLILALSLNLWAAQAAPQNPAPNDKTAPCACCKDKAAGHTCADCCKDGGACDKAGCCKDAKVCKKVKDAKAPCCGKGGCRHDQTDSAKAGACCGNSCPRHGSDHAGQ